jgi:hypothetical protein
VVTVAISVSTSLRGFFALSAAIGLNIRLRVCLKVATPFDGMACKVKSWLSHVIQNHVVVAHLISGVTTHGGSAT